MGVNLFDSNLRQAFHLKNIEVMNHVKWKLSDKNGEIFSKISNAGILLNNKLVALNQLYNEKGINFYQDNLFLPSIIIIYLCDLFNEALIKLQFLCDMHNQNIQWLASKTFEEYENLCSKIFYFSIEENSFELMEVFASYIENICEKEKLWSKIHEELQFWKAKKDRI